MPDERIRRHLTLIERRRAHHHRIHAKRRRPFGRGDRGSGGFAAGAGQQRTIFRHRATHGRDREVGFVLLQLRRFAIRSEDDEAGQRRAKIFLDIPRERARVERTVCSEWSGKRRVDAGESMHSPDLIRSVHGSRNRNSAAITTIWPTQKANDQRKSSTRKSASLLTMRSKPSY